MIRCFDSADIQNVNTTIDPIRDLEIIETEMKLADLESIQRRLDKKNKKNLTNSHLEILEKALNYINNDHDINKISEAFDKKELNSCGLLSVKPKLYVCNVDEKSILNGNVYTETFISKFGEKDTLIISADIENQLNQ